MHVVRARDDLRRGNNTQSLTVPRPLNTHAHRSGQQSVDKAQVRPKPPAPAAGWSPEIGMAVEVSSLVDVVQGNAWFPGVVNERNGDFVFIM